MLDIESILVDHEGETPCGENLEYDPLLLEAREAIEGKPDQQIGDDVIEGAEPDWKLVKKNCLDLCKQTHNLEVVISLTQALMNIEGYAGLADGSMLLEGTIEKYWGCLHPEIDPDDNDPIERLNMLALFEDFNFLLSLQKIELINSKGVGSVSLYDIRNAKQSKEGEEESSAKDEKLIEAILTSAVEEDKKQLYSNLEQCASSFESVIRLLQDEESVGASRSPRFNELLKIINEAKQAIGSHLKDIDNSISDEAVGDSMINQETNSPKGIVSKIEGINTRKDVISSIEDIEDYYHKNEPGSPIPLLLQRAKKLVNKDFIALMEELSPDSINQLEMIIGKTQPNNSYDENSDDS